MVAVDKNVVLLVAVSKVYKSHSRWKIYSQSYTHLFKSKQRKKGTKRKQNPQIYKIAWRSNAAPLWKKLMLREKSALLRYIIYPVSEEYCFWKRDRITDHRA
jgi:hypothetical protein